MMRIERRRLSLRYASLCRGRELHWDGHPQHRESSLGDGTHHGPQSPGGEAWVGTTTPGAPRLPVPSVTACAPTSSAQRVLSTAWTCSARRPQSLCAAPVADCDGTCDASTSPSPCVVASKRRPKALTGSTSPAWRPCSPLPVAPPTTTGANARRGEIPAFLNEAASSDEISAKDRLHIAKPDDSGRWPHAEGGRPRRGAPHPPFIPRGGSHFGGRLPAPRGTGVCAESDER
jgi:hypothetical protein